MRCQRQLFFNKLAGKEKYSYRQPYLQYPKDGIRLDTSEIDNREYNLSGDIQ